VIVWLIDFLIDRFIDCLIEMKKQKSYQVCINSTKSSNFIFIYWSKTFCQQTDPWWIATRMKFTNIKQTSPVQPHNSSKSTLPPPYQCKYQILSNRQCIWLTFICWSLIPSKILWFEQFWQKYYSHTKTGKLFSHRMCTNITGIDFVKSISLYD